MPLVCPCVNHRCGLEERERPRHAGDRKRSQRIALGHRYAFSSESAQRLRNRLKSGGQLPLQQRSEDLPATIRVARRH